MIPPDVIAKSHIKRFVCEKSFINNYKDDHKQTIRRLV